MPNDATPPATLPRAYLQLIPTAAFLSGSLVETEQMLERLRQDMLAAEARGSADLCRAFVVLHRLDAKMDALAKAWSSFYELYKTEKVPEALEAEGLKFQPLAEGYRVGTNNKMYVSVAADRRDRAYQWLRENGLGDLISSTVNSSSLSAAAKHELEENNIDFPPDLFTVAHVTTTSVTGTKK